MINENTLQIFGDSVMKGVLYDEMSNRYIISHTVPCDEFTKISGIETVNRSVFGCTVQKGAKLLTNALEKGLCGSVLIEYGGNDCNFDWKSVSESPNTEHLPVTPAKTFEKIYREIIEKIKSIGITPIIMNLPPIDADKYFKWITKDGLCGASIIQWLGDTQMIYRFQELYSDIITKIAYVTNSVLIDVRSYFLDKHNYSDLLCLDGIHPNTEGQKLITKALLEAV